MKIKEYIKPSFSLLMLVSGILMKAGSVEWFQNRYVALAWYIAAYLPVGLNVMKEAWVYIKQKDYFSEFTLMTIATLGAFAIGEYPEGVAVMLFYCIGEMFQDKAVDKARNNIKNLVAFRPDKASVIKNGNIITTDPANVNVGDVIEVKPGERIPLDGILLSEASTFNTAALTGESMPQLIEKDHEVLAGMISSDSVVHVSVSRPSSDSAISRILDMVQQATERKAPAELFIRKFARIYTPTVICLAVLTIIIPMVYFMITAGGDIQLYDIGHQLFKWINRALVFLVISCPCALVISIPLGYFGGIGAASSRGILFKGSNYLDAITNIDTVVFDKTGTLTKGIFSVQSIDALSRSTDDMLRYVAAIEANSNHPIAKAIIAYANSNRIDYKDVPVTNLKDISGYGMSADINGINILLGTLKLLAKEGISYPKDLIDTAETIVVCAIDGVYAGHILLADTIKDDAIEAIRLLNNRGINSTEILSGDKQALVDKVAKTLKVTKGYGDLLPEGKVAHIDQLKKDGLKVAFVGDGINDAPVLALSDIGIAMGAMGSDMAIETADIVIQNDRPSRVAEAISIGKRTKKIVHENITMAIGVKVLVMILGLLGIANLWEAVFADVGVALIAILNATRIFLNKNTQN
ncbi:heavy metal translocating P-type ATPase [Xylanibacter oryzae]|uniref:heavy metal translocating P-type ATPase n=1 Tax=Xylanibacter oryzae TaxID=185293 RepID=UPI0004AECECF|nr:heavy metal translocating P-type ATPase [Xylanibacter oryzae]